MALARGVRLDRYEIISLLGKGGMGEVYLALDTILDRKVALKLLPHEFVQDQDRFRRFTQEARAISLLNHPNVITIYDIKAVNDNHFIATEFIEGSTLSQMMDRSRMELRTQIDLAIQVAAALGAAHAAGIVHRDIKPKNIMIRPDGVVKVLDFGLAKLTRPQPVAFKGGGTHNSSTTEKGAVLGTVAYMSPEQLRGQEVDARSDIFSLGVVLYQLVADRAPFAGPTASDLVASILTSQPPSLTKVLPQLPAELCRIVGKALRKNPDERYQTIMDMCVDLKALKRELDLKPESALPNATYADDDTGSVIAVEGKSKNRKMLVLLAWAAFFLASAGILFQWFRLYGPGSRNAAFQEMRITKLTNTGRADLPATISPDGKYVACVINNGAQQCLHVIQVATGSDLQIVPPAEVRYQGITFKPDSNYIYYSVVDEGNSSALHHIPTIGGASRKILSDIDSPIALSPEGDRFAFVRNQKDLMIGSTSAGDAKLLASCGSDEFWRNPSWSPDGKVIACSIGGVNATRDYVVSVDARNGTQQKLSHCDWLRIIWIDWLADGSGLVLSGVDEESHLSQIWMLPYPKGEPRRITNDLNSYYGVSLTADSTRLISVQGQRLANIWVVPNGKTVRAAQITFGSGKDEGIAGISWAGNDRVVYVSRISGHRDVWIMSSDGTNQKPLTLNARDNFFPSVSPDGRFIAFVSDRNGKNDIWTMDVDGNNPMQLTRRGAVNRPQWSHDGSWIAFEEMKGAETRLWKVPKEGGDPLALTDLDARLPAVSPDGTLVAFYLNYNRPGSGMKIATIPFSGGLPEILLGSLPWSKPTFFRWTSDARALTYVDTKDGCSDIWTVPLSGGPPVRMTDFKVAQVFAFDWSRDGKQLAASCGSQTSDIVLISNFR